MHKLAGNGQVVHLHVGAAQGSDNTCSTKSFVVPGCPVRDDLALCQVICHVLLWLLCAAGAVVAVQWPNPRILCYKTSYSDMPSSSTRTCCSLYSLNLALCVFWLLVFAIMVIARDVIRIVMCLCFCIIHTSVVIVFRMKFKKFGRPERSYTNDVVGALPAHSTCLVLFGCSS
jgi:hypothetical protein